jgi:hypothetical protein
MNKNTGMGSWQYMRMNYCDYLLYSYITVAEKLVVKVQYFIISEVSCITVMAYTLCKGTNYSCKYSINCT